MVNANKAENHTISLLREPVVVGEVIAIPKISLSTRPIYQTATQEFHINGSGLIGCRELKLDFSPPLHLNEDYEITSKFPLVEDEFQVHLIRGKKWRSGAGELYLQQIDTGAGLVLLNGTHGIQVATVKADAAEHEGAHALTVENTAAKQLIYHDDSSVIISGTGFNPHSPPGTAVRFSNGLTASEYSIIITTETQIDLRLRSGHSWYSDLDALPAVLTVSAIDIGDGFVDLGGSYVGKGRDVATVYERPAVFHDSREIHCSKTTTLTILGSGFASSGADLNLIFSPVLREGIDFSVDMVGRNSMQLSLLNGKKWMSDADMKEGGELYLTAINTRGDPEGWVVLPGQGVLVAKVVLDSVYITNGGADAAEALGLSTSQLYTILGVLGSIVVCGPCLLLIMYFVYNKCFYKPDSRDFIRNSMDASQRGMAGGSVGTIHLSPMSAAAHYNPLSQSMHKGGRLSMGISGPGGQDFDEDGLEDDEVKFTRTGV